MMKKLLLITPRFFQYEKVIERAFVQNNYEVDWYDDRPSQSFISKSLIRINKKLMKKRINKYFNRIINDCKNKKYDEVLIIFGQSFTRDMIIKLRKNLPESKFIFYMWDSLDNFPDRLDFAKEFDAAYTFDNKDAIIHNDIFKFLPLFMYNYEVKPIQRSYKYDFSFVGTIKKGKFRFLKELFSQIESEKKYSVYKHLYIQSKIVYYYYKFKYKEFRKTNSSTFKYNKLKLDEYYKINEESRFVIDCPMDKQNGLSIRTFESISQHKKLITTNKNITDYDFYNPNNIYVYNGGKIDFTNSFFTTKYEEIDGKIIEKYSIENWINILMKGVE